MERRPLKTLKANPNNPRVIRDEKFKKLVKSIKEFPEMLEARPVVVNPDMVVLGGNMRLKALREAGVEEAPVYIASWDEVKQRQFIIKDNVGFGEWDWDALANEWNEEELQDWGLDIPGFEEMQEVLEAEEDDFDVPDEIKTEIVPGDLFEIGEHRLLCGDSTDSDQVAKLMDGEKADLMITDPPYGVKYDANWRNEAKRPDGTAYGASAIGKVNNDDRADWTEAYSLWDGKVAYVWHGDSASPLVGKNLTDCGLVLRNLIIWAKNQHAISRGNYHHKHEPCWYAVRKGENAGWIGDRSQVTLWEIDKPRKSETGHSTQKPVECMEIPMRNHKGNVYDPFLGSGTTMVAAHQLGRKCYGMELDPKYCQVIVDRMHKLDPSLQIKRNGQPYEAKNLETN